MQLSAVFVDTGAWYALQVRHDAHSAVAQATWRQLLAAGHPLVTSNLVLGETYTLIRVRHGYEAAWRFLDLQARTHRLARHFIDEEIEAEAYAILRHYRDPPFSFVDGTSFALMRTLGITEGFAFDAHFATAGFTRLPLSR